jgi:hypothetical protein
MLACARNALGPVAEAGSWPELPGIATGSLRFTEGLYSRRLLRGTLVRNALPTAMRSAADGRAAMNRSTNLLSLGATLSENNDLGAAAMIF